MFETDGTLKTGVVAPSLVDVQRVGYFKNVAIKFQNNIEPVERVGLLLASAGCEIPYDGEFTADELYSQAIINAGIRVSEYFVRVELFTPPSVVLGVQTGPLSFGVLEDGSLFPVNMEYVRDEEYYST